MIRAEGVTVLAPAPDAPGGTRAILRELDAEFLQGQLHLILGANGAGKTTLIRLLAGLLPPSSGRVVFDGSPGDAMADGSTHWPRVAVVFEEPDPQFLAETVEGEIAFGLESMALPASDIRARAREAIDAFGLSGFERRLPQTLSGGEKARVLLAAMWAARPRALLLDQSLAHLDPGSRRSLEHRLLEDARREDRAVIRTHQDAQAPEPDERLQLLSGGRLHDATRLSPRDVLEAADVPWPLAMRVSALLAERGFWTGPLARSAQSLAEGLASRAGSAVLPAAGRVELPSRVDHEGDSRAMSAHGRSEPDGEPVAAFHGVSFGPRGRAKGDAIVSDLNLELRAGSVTALIGASGTGKTTILKLAAQLLDPTEGSIARPAPGLNGTRPAALAMEYPERQLFGRTVDEDVAAALWIRGATTDERRARARAALHAVGLDPDRFGPRVPTTLSEGEKRRAALATLLAEPARLLLFDEPTAGLDPTGRTAVAHTIQRLKEQGHAILMSSHDLDFVSGAADRVVVLGRETGKAGRILGEGRAPEIWRDEALLDQAQLPPPDFVVVARAMADLGMAAPERAIHAESLLQALSIDLGPAVVDTHRG